jgi:hypothetical protein
MFFEWYKRFKEGHENVEDDEDNAHHFLQYQFEFIPQGQAHYVEIFKHKASVHMALSSSSWPKNRLLEWNTLFIHLIWLRVTSSCCQK